MVGNAADADADAEDDAALMDDVIGPEMDDAEMTSAPEKELDLPPEVGGGKLTLFPPPLPPPPAPLGRPFDEEEEEPLNRMLFNLRAQGPICI